ncbi:hypothetical protein ANN_01301 [Periplaneta americana]|uniref:Uncharacterized protein n=1 Tax=Periplaneta americana TaxID=6978 RepID=A0ABQ8TX85_PERAM|nr:hypothetical protein ANN_01301 [Periplaneta americana]
MSPGSSTESYPAFARIGLRGKLRKKPQPGNFPRPGFEPWGHLILLPDALTVTAQVLNLWYKKCSEMGIPIEDKTLHSLLFADDQVIFAGDEDDYDIYGYNFSEMSPRFSAECYSVFALSGLRKAFGNNLNQKKITTSYSEKYNEYLYKILSRMSQETAEAFRGQSRKQSKTYWVEEEGYSRL